MGNCLQRQYLKPESVKATVQTKPDFRVRRATVQRERTVQAAASDDCSWPKADIVVARRAQRLRVAL